MTQKSEGDYRKFLQRVEREIMSHRVIHANPYTRWFKEGELNLEDVRKFAIQFSVFSNLFILAQLKKTFNATSLEEMRDSKEILMNELGVVFRKTSPPTPLLNKERGEGERSDPDYAADPSLVSSEGTVQGGAFHFEAAHFEWLLNFIKPLGLTFNDVGKRKHGWPSTLHFMDGLERYYGSDNFSVGAGASFAIEHWAAAGFWKELIEGLKKFRDQSRLRLNLGFWTFHDRLEEQHAEHTEEELKKVYFYDAFVEDEFIDGGKAMLDCCAVFWDGLNEDRLKRHAR
jgi:hypothetical protein